MKTTGGDQLARQDLVDQTARCSSILDAKHVALTVSLAAIAESTLKSGTMYSWDTERKLTALTTRWIESVLIQEWVSRELSLFSRERRVSMTQKSSSLSSRLSKVSVARSMARMKKMTSLSESSATM